ncbi:MAG: hypothetical protein ACLPYS_18170 [Vulcanimicrobiaceae bacterium]
MRFIKRVPQLAAAALFALGASTSILATEATHAGQPSAGLLAPAPQAASAAVTVGVGIGVGAPHRYWRYAYRGGTWARVGWGYAYAPGYVGGYYVGYASPPYYGPRYYRPYAYYHSGYYGHPYYARAYYGRPYWGWRR